MYKLQTEIVEQTYHVYYCKVSHSGYHFLSCIYLFVEAGTRKSKQPDILEVVGSFVQPKGFPRQLNAADCERLFSAKEYIEACKWSDEEL